MPEQLGEKSSLLPLTRATPPPVARTARRVCIAALAALVALVHLTVLFFCDNVVPRAVFFGLRDDEVGIGLPEEITHRWGQYAPWFPAGNYTPPPPGCAIDQVHILQRHGARHPTVDDDYARAVSRLQNATRYTSRKLAFLDGYKYTLGEEDLVSLGAQQSFDAGVQAWDRYAPVLGLTSADVEDKVFLRASGMSRVADSARNWSAGFLGDHHRVRAPLPLLTLPESQNNTLNNDCPNAPSSDPYTDAWLHTFAPRILCRLHSMAQGVLLEEEDVRRLLGICIFETISLASAGKKHFRSHFRDLFSVRDWKEWEYWAGVEKYYETGYGNPLGPVQGVGYVNELLARLTDSPVRDNTTHNDTLPFPLGKHLYADFTHENLMVAVYAAMGLFNVSTPLDTGRIPGGDRSWVANRMVPFSSRMVVERLTCEGTSLLGDGTFVRVFVNDASQPLEFCRSSTQDFSQMARHGLCTLAHFVKSQTYARESAQADFKRCYNQ